MAGSRTSTGAVHSPPPTSLVASRRDKRWEALKAGDSLLWPDGRRPLPDGHRPLEARVPQDAGEPPGEHPEAPRAEGVEPPRPPVHGGGEGRARVDPQVRPRGGHVDAAAARRDPWVQGAWDPGAGRRDPGPVRPRVRGPRPGHRALRGGWGILPEGDEGPAVLDPHPEP